MNTAKPIKKDNELPKPDHKSPQLNVMEMAVKAAGGHFRKHFSDIEQRLTRKGGVESSYIQQALENLTNILGNELAKTKRDVFLFPENVNELPDDGSYWLLSPVTAPKNFENGRMPVGIRMVYVKDAKAVVAMYATPTNHEIFFAEKGMGATGGSRLRVAGEKDNISIFAYIGEAGKKDVKLSSIMAKMEDNGITSLISGCFSQNICEVAAGKASAIVAYNLSPSEVAFAELLIKEAGGVIKTTAGEKVDITSTSIVAGCDSAVNSVLKII